MRLLLDQLDALWKLDFIRREFLHDTLFIVDFRLQQLSVMVGQLLHGSRMLELQVLQLLLIIVIAQVLLPLQLLIFAHLLWQSLLLNVVILLDGQLETRSQIGYLRLEICLTLLNGHLQILILFPFIHLRLLLLLLQLPDDLILAWKGKDVHLGCHLVLIRLHVLFLLRFQILQFLFRLRISSEGFANPSFSFYPLVSLSCISNSIMHPSRLFILFYYNI